MTRTRLIGAAAALSVPMALGIGGVASAATSPASQSSSCSDNCGQGGSGSSQTHNSLLPELGADLQTLLTQIGDLLD
jgi:hypothetical protein